ncbi:MAG: FHA domain-containing protein, partial [Polyangiaceae bacterium]
MAIVFVEEGPNRGAAFAVEDDCVIGRDLASAAPIFDERASRRHCAIRREGDGWVLADLGSRNGTSLNGMPIGPEPAPIVAGDLVRIGATVLRFEPDATLPPCDATTVSGGEPPADAGRRPIAGPSISALPCSAPAHDARRWLAPGMLVAASPTMRAVLELARRAARSDA